jgi:2-haloacid dehalogenase
MQEQSVKRDTVVFDLGGVLIDWDPRYLYRKIFQNRQADMDFFLSQVCHQQWNELQDAGRSFAEAIQERSQKFPAYQEQIEAYYQRWDEMLGGEVDGVAAILQEIQSRGYPTYALSNWSAETFHHAQKRFDFLRTFESMVISGRINMIKPHPQIYHHLLQKYALKASQCVFIDDNKANIQAAQEIGFEAIHFTSGHSLRHELTSLGIL